MRKFVPIMLGILFTVANATLFFVTTARGQHEAQYGNASLWLRLVNGSGFNGSGDGGIIEGTADSLGRQIVTGSISVSDFGDSGAAMLVNAPDGGLPVAVLNSPTVHLATVPLAVEVMNTGASAVPVSGSVVAFAPDGGLLVVGDVLVQAPDGGLPVTAPPGLDGVPVVAPDGIDVSGSNVLTMTAATRTDLISAANYCDAGTSCFPQIFLVKSGPGTFYSATFTTGSASDAGAILCLMDGNPDGGPGVDFNPLLFGGTGQPGGNGLATIAAPTAAGIPYTRALYVIVDLPNNACHLDPVWQQSGFLHVVAQ